LRKSKKQKTPRQLSLVNPFFGDFMPKELQSNDCKNLIKKESRTTARYHREAGYKAGKQVDISRSTMDRYAFIKKFGSEEIIELVNSEQISIWKAYKFVRAQQMKKLFDLIDKEKV